MKTLKLSLILIISLNVSCAFISKLSRSSGSEKGKLISEKSVFELADKAGEFEVYRSTGLSKKDKSFVVKEKIISPAEGDEKPLEKLISISIPGNVKGLSVLRPKISQYTVWFAGKRYFSESKINLKNKSIIVNLTSPEEQWSGEREFKFPKGTGVFCYYSQIIECANFTGFLKKAIENETGDMNFHIMWEGYPYIQEQYLNMPDEFFTRAKLSYDGKNKLGESRFSLSFSGQVIFYFVDKNAQMTKRLWVAQGYTLTKRK